MRHVLLLALLLLALPLAAQTEGGWREVYDRLYAEDDEEGGALNEETMDMLDEMAENPLNVNAATPEELDALPFLTAREVDAICIYVHRYDGMLTLSELKAIPEINHDKQLLLSHFLYCGPTQRETAAKKRPDIKHTLYYSGKAPLYQKKGDALPEKSGGYQGIAYQHQLRYTLKYGKTLQAGLTGANDAGEPFFGGRNYLGYDFYSFYLMLSDIKLSQESRLVKGVAGRYRAGFGMGLTLNNNFSLGKMTSLTSGGRVPIGLRQHSSSSDAKYFQGVAVTFANDVMKKRQPYEPGMDSVPDVRRTDRLIWTATILGSLRYIHATLRQDSIATILSSGYHRTLTEMEKKNAAAQSVLGADITLRYKKFAAGLTAVFSHLNKPLAPDKTQAYRQYSAEGRNFLTAGVNYALTLRQFTLRGEVSGSPASQADKGSSGVALATVNMLTYSPAYWLAFSLQHRYYAPRYTTMFGRSVAENSAMQDEHGVFLGVRAELSGSLTLYYYGDYAHFSLPKYQVSSASNMVENVVTLAWHDRHWSLSLRGRMKNRQYDNEDKQWLVWKNNVSVRLLAEIYAKPYKKSNTDPHASLLLQYSHYDKERTASNGYLAMVSGGTGLCQWLSADASAGYFNTSDAYSAIYAYERGMSYRMNYQQLYGHGMRFAAALNATFARRMTAAVKFGATKYFDRYLIGTGLEEIQSSLKADIDFQLRLKF